MKFILQLKLALTTKGLGTRAVGGFLIQCTIQVISDYTIIVLDQNYCVT